MLSCLLAGIFDVVELDVVGNKMHYPRNEVETTE